MIDVKQVLKRFTTNVTLPKFVFIEIIIIIIKYILANTLRSGVLNFFIYLFNSYI